MTTTAAINNKALVKAFSALVNMFEAYQLYTTKDVPAYDGLMVCESSFRSVVVEYTIRIKAINYTSEDGAITSGYDEFANNIALYADMLKRAQDVIIESYNMGDYYTIVLSIPYDRDLPYDVWHP